jgi:hypothetical protein
MDGIGNPWKMATIGMALVVVTAVVTTVVVSGRTGREARQPVEPAMGSASPAMPIAAPPSPDAGSRHDAPRRDPAPPGARCADACNRR